MTRLFALLRGHPCVVFFLLSYALLCQIARIDAESSIPVFSCSSLKRDSFMYSTIAFAGLICLHPRSLRTCAEPGGRQHAAAKPPLYVVYIRSALLVHEVLLDEAYTRTRSRYLVLLSRRYLIPANPISSADCLGCACVREMALAVPV